MKYLRTLALCIGVVVLALALYANAHQVPGSSGWESDEFKPVLVLPFCGQGGNAATHWIGPQTATGVDITPGNATCDGYDSGTNAAGADNVPLGMSFAYEIQAMFCQLDSGTDDTLIMTIYDDTVAAPIGDCAITAAGGIETCYAINKVSVAAGSLLAIESLPFPDASCTAANVPHDCCTGSGAGSCADDNLSDQDFACWLFVQF